MENMLLTTVIALVVTIVVFALIFINILLKETRRLSNHNTLLISALIDDEDKRKFLMEQINRQELERHEEFVENVSNSKLEQKNSEQKVELKDIIKLEPIDDHNSSIAPKRKVKKQKIEIKFEDDKEDDK